MITVSAIIDLTGQEIVPIRAIPFVTGNLTALSIAKLLADPEIQLIAYVLDSNGRSSAMRPNDWKRVVADLHSLAAIGNHAPTRDQLELLPSSTFVYWKSFWRAYERAYLPDRSELTLERYTPDELANFELHRNVNMPKKLVELVFEGFSTASVLAQLARLVTPTVNTWTLTKPKRFQGYTEPLYQLLETAHVAGRSRPTARDVLQTWETKRPSQIAKVILGDSLDYYLASGETKSANLKAISAAITAMTGKSPD
jgi:hypothetical protein